MKILVTGATGYIGKRLIPMLINDGHTVICAVRDKQRADKNYLDEPLIDIVEVDILKLETLQNIPKDFVSTLDLDTHLSQNRTSGLAAMIKQIGLYAIAFSMRK